jgi:hypothetical protein
LDSIEALEAKVGADSSAVVTSLDYLVTNTSSSNPGHKHTVANGASDVTSSAAELNILTGVTATATELNHLVGLTSSAAELNITDGGETTERVLNVNCKCRAYLTAQQNNLTDTAANKINLNGEQYDVGGDFDVANYRFVAPVTGYYQVNAGISLTNVIADKSYYATIQVNGSAYAQAVAHASLIATMIITVSDVVPVTAGQYVELYCTPYCGASTVDVYPGGGFTYMSIHLLSV